MTKTKQNKTTTSTTTKTVKLSTISMYRLFLLILNCFKIKSDIKDNSIIVNICCCCSINFLVLLSWSVVLLSQSYRCKLHKKEKKSNLPTLIFFYVMPTKHFSFYGLSHNHVKKCWNNFLYTHAICHPVPCPPFNVEESIMSPV